MCLKMERIDDEYLPQDTPDGVQPENETEEDEDEGGLRYKALLLLIIFLIPTIIVLVNLLSGNVQAGWMQTVHPHLPQMDQVLTF